MKLREDGGKMEGKGGCRGCERGILKGFWRWDMNDTLHLTIKRCKHNIHSHQLYISYVLPSTNISKLSKTFAHLVFVSQTIKWAGYYDESMWLFVGRVNKKCKKRVYCKKGLSREMGVWKRECETESAIRWNNHIYNYQKHSWIPHLLLTRGWEREFEFTMTRTVVWIERGKLEGDRKE